MLKFLSPYEFHICFALLSHKFALIPYLQHNCINRHRYQIMVKLEYYIDQNTILIEDKVEKVNLLN